MFLQILPRITRSWSDFWQIVVGHGPIKDGSKNRLCVTEAWAGEIFHCRFLPIESRLRPDLAVSVCSLSGHCLISVGSLSGESGCCRDRFGSFFTMRKIQIGSESDWELENRDEFGWKRLETAESGRFLNNIWLLAWLNNCFCKFCHESHDLDHTFDKL